MKNAKTRKKLYKNFVFDIFIGIIALALAIVMLPPFNIGQTLLNILRAATLLAYIVIYLFDRARRTKGMLFILSLSELIIVAVMALGLVLRQFRIFEISSVCGTVGIVLWLRGIIALVSMYITAQSSKTKYSLPLFSLYLFVTSLGMFLYARPFVSDLVLTWLICIFFFASALVFGALSLLYAPSKKK